MTSTKCFCGETNLPQETTSVKLHENEGSGDEEKTPTVTTTNIPQHYTAVRSTPTCMTFTSKSKSRKRRSRGRDEQKKVKKRCEAMENKVPLKTADQCFGQATKLHDGEILFKEIKENTYSEELLKTLKYNSELYKNGDLPSLKNIETRKLKVQHLDENKLLTMSDINELEAIVELKGRCMLCDEAAAVLATSSSSSPSSSSVAAKSSALKSTPNMFVYNKLSNVDICIDARTHGNISRFACFSSDGANTELRHVFNEENKIMMFLFASRKLAAGDEIILPLNCSFQNWSHRRASSSSISSHGSSAVDSNNHMSDSGESHDARRLSPLKLTIPKNNPQQQQLNLQTSASELQENLIDPMFAQMVPSRKRGNKKRTGRNKSKDTAGGGGGSINQQPLSPNTSEVNHKTAAAADDAAAAVAAATSTADQHDAVTTSTELLDKAVIDAEDDEASKAGAKTMRKDSEASSGADSSGKPKSKPAKKSQFSRASSNRTIVDMFTKTATLENGFWKTYTFNPGNPIEGEDFRIGRRRPAPPSSITTVPKKHFLKKAREDGRLSPVGHSENTVESLDANFVPKVAVKVKNSFLERFKRNLLLTGEIESPVLPLLSDNLTSQPSTDTSPGQLSSRKEKKLITLTMYRKRKKKEKTTQLTPSAADSNDSDEFSRRSSRNDEQQHSYEEEQQRPPEELRRSKSGIEEERASTSSSAFFEHITSEHSTPPALTAPPPPPHQSSSSPLLQKSYNQSDLQDQKDNYVKATKSPYMNTKTQVKKPLSIIESITRTKVHPVTQQQQQQQVNDVAVAAATATTSPWMDVVQQHTAAADSTVPSSAKQRYSSTLTSSVSHLFGRRKSSNETPTTTPGRPSHIKSTPATVMAFATTSSPRVGQNYQKSTTKSSSSSRRLSQPVSLQPQQPQKPQQPQQRQQPQQLQQQLQQQPPKQPQQLQQQPPKQLQQQPPKQPPQQPQQQIARVITNRSSSEYNGLRRQSLSWREPFHEHRIPSAIPSIIRLGSGGEGTAYRPEAHPTKYVVNRHRTSTDWETSFQPPAAPPPPPQVIPRGADDAAAANHFTYAPAPSRSPASNRRSPSSASSTYRGHHHTTSSSYYYMKQRSGSGSDAPHQQSEKPSSSKYYYPDGYHRR